MVALGPRVGGAHVDVNLKFDDKSLNSLGKRIHTQLAKIGDQNRKVYRSLGSSAVTAWRAALGAALSAAPLIGSAASALAGTITELGGAFYSLGQSSLAAIPFITSFGLAGITASIGLNNFAAAVSETNPKGLLELLDGMPKEMQKAVLATRDLSQSLRAALFPKLFAGLSDGIASLNQTGVIQRGLEGMATSINGLVKSLLNYANTKAGNATVDTFLKNNAKTFAALSKAVVPFLDSFLLLVNALTPASIRLANRLTDLGKHFQDLTHADDFGKRIDDSMKKAETTSGLLLKVLANLGSAISNVFSAANPATNEFLQTLVNVTQRFEDFTDSAKGKKSILDWAFASNRVMRQFGETIREVFRVFSALADDRIIISFLATVEGAFKLINKLPLDKAVAAFASLTEVLQPVSSLFLAIIASSVVYNIAIGSLAGQLGGLFSVLQSFGGLARVFFIFGPLLGLAAGIGFIISRSDELKGKLSTTFGAFKDVVASLGAAFSTLVTALKPVGDSLKPLLASLEKMAGVAIGAVLDAMTRGLRSLSGVIDNAAKSIPAVVQHLTGLFKVGGQNFGSKLKTSFSQLVKTFQTFKGVVVKEVLPVLKEFGAYLVANVLPIFGQVVDIVVNSVIPTFVALAKFVYGTLYPAILAIVLAVAKRLAPVFAQFVETFKNDVLPTVKKFVDSIRNELIPAIAPVIKKILVVVGVLAAFAAVILSKVLPPLIKFAGFLIRTIVPVIVKLVVFFAKMTDGLFSLGTTFFITGKKAFDFAKSLVTAVTDGIDFVLDKITGLPGFIIDLVPKMLKAGKKLLGGFFDGIMDAAKGIGGFLGDVGDAVVGAIIGAFNNVVQFINDSLPNSIPLKGLPDINLPDNPLPKIPGYAKGTSFYPGGIGLVGEEGPELVNLPRGSKISTNAETRGALKGAADDNSSGGTGTTINIGALVAHDYSDFERRIREKSRLAAIGGRRVSTT